MMQTWGKIPAILLSGISAEIKKRAKIHIVGEAIGCVNSSKNKLRSRGGTDKVLTPF